MPRQTQQQLGEPMRGIALALLAAMGSAWLAPHVALAHHSFAMFDASKTLKLAGTIKRFDWSNPHTWIWVNVVNARGEVETWGVEGSSPNNLIREGWTKDTLKPGDKVSLLINPLRDGGHGGSFLELVLPEGRVLRMRGFGGRSAESLPKASENAR